MRPCIGCYEIKDSVAKSIRFKMMMETPSCKRINYFTGRSIIQEMYYAVKLSVNLLSIEQAFLRLLVKFI